MRHTFFLLLTCALLLLIGGCMGDRHHAYMAQRSVERDPDRANALAREAGALFESKPNEAERLLREALRLDLYCGLAHNNLGVVLLEREAYYEAAAEFEWARKLMPGQPGPRVNLAITLERAGFLEDATQELRTAREISPGSLEVASALAWMQLRHGRDDPQTHDLLRLISLRSPSQSWREWARLQLKPSGTAERLGRP